MLRALVIIFVIVCVNTFAEDTNEVILPQTEFFTEGATSPIIEERDNTLLFKEQKKSIYESHSIRDFKSLEEEAKKEFLQETKSKILSFFSYGINDILNFSVIGFNQISAENFNISTVIKFNRFKRPDIVFYQNVAIPYTNTFKDVDLASVSVGISSSYTFWNTIFNFYEEFRGLWSNSSYLDEKNRAVSIDSKLRYQIDKDSSIKSHLNLNHYFDNIRNRSLYNHYTSFNDFSISLDYIYGIENFNFFNMSVGIGANAIGFTDTGNLSSGIYGNVSFSFMFPLYGNTWSFGMKVGIVPDTFLPMEWFSKISLGYKLNDNIATFISIFKEYTRFDMNFLSSGLNFLHYLPLGDSSLGIELNPKIFFLGNNSLNLFVGYSYYLNKVFDSYTNNIHIIGSTNTSVVYSRVLLDIISIDWLNFEASYTFSLFLPTIPYAPIHSIILSSKFLLGSFNISFGVSGESAKESNFETKDILPYLIVYIETEWEIIKNLSINLKVDNALNNLVEIRKDSIIYEPFYASLGLKVKL
ncbi:MAG: hypothetical protein ACK4F9_05895 [Brevinematia bacterium]